jgi:hypothetical protein
METQEKIRELIQPNDYMASIDLADAFFSVPLHTSCKRFVVFEFENQRYCYNVLPFGMSSSPRIFSKVLKPVIIYLRTKGITISFYLDDIFICASSKVLLDNHVASVLSILLSLGFLPNYKKSHLSPTQSILHLGYLWDSKDMSLSLPVDKIEKTRTFAKVLLSSPPLLRRISSFLGLVISHCAAFPSAPLHYRSLQLQLCLMLRKNVPWDQAVVLSDDSIKDLQWWASCPLTLPSSSFLNVSTQFTLSTDASLSGWGGVLSNGLTVSGHWSQAESTEHINFLELKAIHLCILSFLSIIKDHSIKILSDNSTAVSYVNKMGGTHSSSLCKLALSIWDTLLDSDISCFAVHIPGVRNEIADAQSRERPDAHDYALQQDAFSVLLTLLPFQPALDLFASRLTAKLPRYVSWHRDPFSVYNNAFSFTWSSDMYAFPPITLISRVVKKIIADEAQNVVLITPAWPGLVSLPLILSHLISNPVFIPSTYLVGCLPTRHPFNLMAWPISTNAASGKAFHERSQKLSLAALPHLRYSRTSGIGNSFVCGLQSQGIQIDYLSL